MNIIDGYMDSSANKLPIDNDQKNYEKYLYIQELYKEQSKIDEEIQFISNEIKKLPTVPKNIERWASSFSSQFKISDLDKISKLNRRYGYLMEERKYNGSKIKVFAIENIMDQINETINE